MSPDHFDAGIRHLEIAFTETMDSKRRAVYFQHLSPIPNDMWDAGILRLADQVRFPRLPLIAEIGEACVPGQAETEDLDKWTGRWTKTLTPWTERLAVLSRPVLPAPPVQLQIPGPRDPLSEAEQALLVQPEFQGLFRTTDEQLAYFFEKGRQEQRARIAEIEANKQASRMQQDAAIEQGSEIGTDGSPYATASLKQLLNTHSRESQAVREYWTPERTAERKEFLHRQLAWLSRRDEAERTGELFTELRPEY